MTDITSSQERVGRFITSTTAGETVKAYLPNPLPPLPALRLEPYYELMERANQALGRLDGLASMIGDTDLFIYYYVRKEAVLSSQIEGTQSTLSDLLLYESEGLPNVSLDDVQEVSRYVAAMNYGLDELSKGMPLCNRLIKEIHNILLTKGRGSEKSPGEFRRSQNWIGGSRPGNAQYVPCPPEYVDEAMSDLEKFLHLKDGQTPVLVKAALAHHQFETVHPFLDGNGRVGRLMITLLLCSERALAAPILYLSLFFKANKEEYYGLLQAVRERGDWESWMSFFFRGVLETSQQATDAAKQLLEVTRGHRAIIESGNMPVSVMRVFSYLLEKPIATIPSIVKRLGLTTPTVTSAVEKLESLGVVHEVTGKPRNRVYVYHDFLDILKKGTEPLPKA